MGDLAQEGSAEQKKRLGEISKEIEKMAESMDASFGVEEERTLINKDTVVTDEFTIVGDRANP